MDEERKPVTIYTDGACDPNPGGPGGYGVVMVADGKKKELSGGFRATTNNRMELMAAIIGLEALKTPSQVRLYSDSSYLVRAMTKGWVKRWQANDWWRTKSERAVNVDLWERLLELCGLHEVKFIWVQGHAGNPNNERCDQLAVAALRGQNLPADQGYERRSEQEMDAKITRVGQPCRKCGTPVVKRVPRRKSFSKQETYFEYYLYCPKCATMYLVEEARKPYKQQKLF
jgi:ribonuclease HI